MARDCQHLGTLRETIHPDYKKCWKCKAIVKIQNGTDNKSRA